MRILGCILDNSKNKNIDEIKTILEKNNLTLLEGINWVYNFLAKPEEQALTTPIFRYNLIKKAKSANKTIILPEGNEWRTLTAANICVKRNLAKCVLLGDKHEINNIAEQQRIKLSPKLQIINPKDIISKYIEPMVELRKNKGLTAEKAAEQLNDNVVLGTMMVQMNDVDGLVSGARHTTANTIRPALQLIKTKPDTKLVSSVYFIGMPNQILAFADCAINIKPTPEELADIAIQSADTSAKFEIIPRVAMISYGTGTSAHGEDVEKVREATEIAKQKRPDLLIEGPIQYDAATVPEVAKIKLPNSPVAGKATVLVFPDLNTANSIAKAVQRSAKAVAIGPLSQGLNKPVNDLSRGCLVQDIVFTIALTAVQATSKEYES